MACGWTGTPSCGAPQRLSWFSWPARPLHKMNRSVTALRAASPTFVGWRHRHLCPRLRPGPVGSQPCDSPPPLPAPKGDLAGLPTGARAGTLSMVLHRCARVSTGGGAGTRAWPAGTGGTRPRSGDTAQWRADMCPQPSRRVGLRCHPMLWVAEENTGTRARTVLPPGTGPRLLPSLPEPWASLRAS